MNYLVYATSDSGHYGVFKNKLRASLRAAQQQTHLGKTVIVRTVYDDGLTGILTAGDMRILREWPHNNHSRI